MEIQNTHRVPLKQWRKWDQQQKTLFNNLYEEIKRMGSDLFLHTVTVQRKISDAEFDVLAWNAAWTAADVLRGHFKDEMHTIYKDQTIAVDTIARST